MGCCISACTSAQVAKCSHPRACIQVRGHLAPRSLHCCNSSQKHKVCCTQKDSLWKVSLRLVATHSLSDCFSSLILTKLTHLGSGGTVGGRYLGDVWALHLDPLVWEPVTTSSSQPQVPGPFDDGKGDRPHYLPPCAGHALVSWGSNLLCIGGHTKVGGDALISSCGWVDRLH